MVQTDTEQVLWQETPHKRVIPLWIFGAIVGSLIFVPFIYWMLLRFILRIIRTSEHITSFADLFPRQLWWYILIGAILGSIYMLGLRKTYRYTITNQRVIFKGGIFTSKEHSLSFSKITDVGQSQDILERFTRTGTLSIYTAGVAMSGRKAANMPAIMFSGLADTEQPRRIIFEHIRKNTEVKI